MKNCMTKTIAICNQKGGVGKTTTTVNLGIGLAKHGMRVLLVDCDPQGDLTASLGWQDTDGLSVTLADKLSAVIYDRPLDESGILRHTEGIDLIPSNLTLSAMEMNLVCVMRREEVLKNYLRTIKDNYDYIIIDCNPSLGMLTLNALAAADSVIVPVQAQYLPAKGMSQLLYTIARVRKNINSDLQIDGILLTLVDKRTKLAKATLDTLKESFGEHIRIFNSFIPMAVKAAETSCEGMSIYAYAPDSAVAQAYSDFTKEVLSLE